MSGSWLEWLPFVWDVTKRPILVVLRHWKPVVRGFGFQYFPHRAALHKTYSSLGSRLETAHSVDAMWVVGAAFFDDGINVHKVKRLILPNPDSRSALYYFSSVSQSHGPGLIRSITQKAQKAGATVRWCDEFLFQSITLVDTDEPTGWAHFEAALPNGQMNMRAGYTIFKRRSPDAVQELAEIFQKIWDGSKSPADIQDQSKHTLVATALEPLEIFYDPSDPEDRFAREWASESGDKFIGRYWVGVRNNGNLTLQDVSLRALTNNFVMTTIAISHLSSDGIPSEPILFQQNHLHPGVLEIVELFGFQSAGSETEPALMTRHVFQVQARAKDTRAVTADFEYDPSSRPRIRRL